MPEQREGEALVQRLEHYAASRVGTGPNLAREAAAALAASQEKERQLTEALEQIADPSYVGNYKPDEIVAIYRKWAANTLDSTQTHGGGEK